MALCNTKHSYGSATKFLHWLIALLIILMIIGGASLGLIPQGPTKSLIIQLHKSTGVTIFFLMIIRLFWRLCNITPTPPKGAKQWEIGISHLTHFLLYLTAIAMPLSGMLMSLAKGYPVSFWQLFNIHIPGIPHTNHFAYLMNATHGYLAWVLSVLIALHILAALKHHFINHDNVLKRMWVGK